MKRGALVRALAPLAVIGGIALLLGTHGLYRCPLAWVLGQPCPTCGITRATAALIHLDFGAAWRMHPLVFVVVPYLAVLFVVDANAWIRRGERGAFLRRRGARVLGLVIAVSLFVLWIARFFGAFGGKVDV